VNSGIIHYPDRRAAWDRTLARPIAGRYLA